jgi:hypothetical protein
MVMTALIVMFSSNCNVLKISLQFSEIIGFIYWSPVNSIFFLFVMATICGVLGLVTVGWLLVGDAVP